MEGGELSLEQALAAHKRGLELARFCQQRLESAQQQVKVLEGDVLKPLEKVSATAEDESGSGGD
jgi:exodeoxyribonuclease VII small subunit